MSRIGKKPVAIPSGVTANIEEGTLSVKGPKGTLSMGLSDLVDYKIDGEEITVKPANDTKAARSHWGMQRTLVSNLVEGVRRLYQGAGNHRCWLSRQCAGQEAQASARLFA